MEGGGGQSQRQDKCRQEHLMMIMMSRLRDLEKGDGVLTSLSQKGKMERKRRMSMGMSVESDIDLRIMRRRRYNVSFVPEIQTRVLISLVDWMEQGLDLAAARTRYEYFAALSILSLDEYQVKWRHSFPRLSRGKMQKGTDFDCWRISEAVQFCGVALIIVIGATKA